MGNDKKPTNKSRRDFFSSLLQSNKKTEMVKMLTPDGKLVQVSKALLEQASTKQKATNKEVYDWMKNPSKKNS